MNDQNGNQNQSNQDNIYAYEIHILYIMDKNMNSTLE